MVTVHGRFSLVDKILAADISSTAAVVALFLWCRTSGLGMPWPSVATIGQVLRTSERSVQRALRQLERAGFIGVTPDGHIAIKDSANDTDV